MNLTMQNIWCRLFNLHKYNITETYDKLDRHGNVIGKVILSRCTNCGKIKSVTVYTEEGYGRF